MTTNLNAEAVEPLFLDERVQRPYTVWRTNSRGQRWYFRKEADEIKFFFSVTTMIRAAQPTPIFVQKKIGEVGWDEWQRYMNLKAAKGTLFHTLCAEFLRTGEANLAEIQARVEAFADEQGIAAEDTEDTEDWTIFLQKGLLSFAKFCVDTNLKPLAIELVLTSKQGFAGAIDLVAEIDHPKNEGERVVILVDIKSGSVFDEHKLQLHAYAQLWRENFPHIPLDSLWNWSPKDWILAKGTMSYDFKKQSGGDGEKEASDTEMLTELECVITLYKLRESTQPSGFSLIEGSIKLGQPLVNSVRFVSAAEAAQNHIEQSRGARNGAEKLTPKQVAQEIHDTAITYEAWVKEIHKPRMNPLKARMTQFVGKIKERLTSRV